MSLLNSYEISPTVFAKLRDADFLRIADLQTLKPTELCAATSLSLKECIEVLRIVSSADATKRPIKFEALNLKQFIERDEGTTNIVTFCESLDELLGGGIPIGTITEISGTPGIGKTQLCLQACISVQLPQSCGGVEGEAVYIDTEGSFSVSRIKEMSIWAQKHVNKVLNSEDHPDFNVEKMLKQIYFFRCQSYLELIAVVKNLASFLEEHPRVKLIVIDSIAFHFRRDFKDMMTRTSLLCSLTQDLIKRATERRLAVLVTNQMTTRIEAVGGGSQLVTALGETWGHCPTLRLCLFWIGTVRSAKLMKSPHMDNSTIQFQITSGGIRDKHETLKRKIEDL